MEKNIFHFGKIMLRIVITLLIVQTAVGRSLNDKDLSINHHEVSKTAETEMAMDLPNEEELEKLKVYARITRALTTERPKLDETRFDDMDSEKLFNDLEESLTKAKEHVKNIKDLLNELDTIQAIPASTETSKGVKSKVKRDVSDMEGKVNVLLKYFSEVFEAKLNVLEGNNAQVQESFQTFAKELASVNAMVERYGKQMNKDGAEINAMIKRTRDLFSKLINDIENRNETAINTDTEAELSRNISNAMIEAETKVFLMKKTATDFVQRLATSAMTKVTGVYDELAKIPQTAPQSFVMKF